MSTRCLIAIAKDGHYLSIYCHHDGYDAYHGVGPTLRAHYNSAELAADLIALGDISYLQSDKACAYHRDRGDAWAQTQPRRSTSESQLLDPAGACDAQYLYIFQAEGWVSRQLTL